MSADRRHGGESDRALVRRVLAGDEDGFRTLFRSYHPRLYRFALSRLGHNHDAAEEVVQNALSKAFRKLRTYRGEAALFTWLCGFCRYEVLEHRRRSGRRPARVALCEDVPEIRSALESLRDDEGPEHRLDRLELGRRIRAALDRLPRRYGHALDWKYLQELPVNEIARRLALRPKAAESLLTRARAAFRDAFTSLGEGPPEPAAVRALTRGSRP